MDGPDRPRLFFAEEVDRHSLPAMAPYLLLEGSGEVGREALARRMWHEASETKADVVLISGASAATSASSLVPDGASLSSGPPVSENDVLGVCYRICPARLGFHTDEDGIVVSVDDESDLRDAGLQEGDKVISIDGVPVSQELSSGHYRELLTLQEAEPVKLIWIRPETGRMEATVRPVGNPPTHLDRADSIPWYAPSTRPDWPTYRDGY
jgi:hypothetical protein